MFTVWWSSGLLTWAVAFSVQTIMMLDYDYIQIYNGD